MKLDTILQKSGLTPKESLLYLAALELGSASVQKIAVKAGVVRSTAYEVLENLRFKGLVTTFLKKHIRYYSAEDPNQVVNFAESRVETLKEALPELNAIVGKSRRRPSMRFYEGKDGMKIILNEILNEADELISFASVDDVFRELEQFENFVTARIKKKIPLRVILRASAKAQERQRLGPGELRQVRIVPQNPEFHGLMYIWKNKVALFSFVSDYVATVTESKEVAALERTMFEHIWQGLPSS